MGEHSRRAALLLRGQHQRARASARLPATRSRRTRPPGSRARSWSSTTPPRTGRRRRCAGLGRRSRLIALERRDGQGRERLPAAAGGARPLLPAAERGRRAAAGRRRRAGRRARGRSGGGGGRCTAALLRGRAAGPAPGGCPGLGTALAGAVFLHRWLTVQSGGDRTRAVGWVQSSAMLVRRDAAEQVGWLDPDFFVYSDETDFCKRLRRRGLAHPLRAGRGARRPPRPDGERRRPVPSGARSSSTATATCYLRKHKGTRRRLPPAPAARLPLPGAGSRRRWSCPGTLAAALMAPRPPGAAAAAAARASARPRRITT